MRIKNNLIIINIFVITVALAFSTIIYLTHLQSAVQQDARDTEERAIRTFWQLLLAKGNDFRAIDGKLLAGDYVINGNYELPDKIKDIFGGTATIFMGDTRVSTNVLKDDGSRAIGNKLTGPAYDAIFIKHSYYRGEAPVLGIPYFTAYDPIHDNSGNIVGVLYVGVKKSEFLATYSRLKANVITGTVILEILLSVLARGLLRERNREDSRIRKMAGQTRLITDSVPAAIAYIDAGLHYQFANRRYQELFGGDLADLIGKSVEEVLGEKLLDARQENIDQALAGNEILFSSRIPQNNGGPIHLQSAYVPHKGKNGEVIGFFIQHHDITDLTLTQEALRTSGERYRTLFNTTGAMTFVVEEDTTVALVNEEFIRFSGWSREEVEGQLSWTAFVTPESRERMLGYHRARRIDPASAPRSYECEVIWRDGSLRNMLVHVNLVPGTRQSIVSFLDITTCKQLEASLQNQLGFLQVLIDTIPSPIFYKDRAGRYLGYNLAFQEALGLTRDRIIGKTVYDIAPPELAGTYFAMDEALFSNPGTQVYESSIVNADGCRHDVVFNKATFTGKDGLVGGLVGIILDVTERKQTEEALVAAEKEFRCLVEQSLVGNYIIQESRFVYVNPKMAEIFGYSQAELTSGITHLDLTAEQNRLLTAENVRRRTAGEVQSINYLFTGLRKDGTKIIVEVYGSVTEYNGKPAIIGTLLDVTASKQAEKALRESEERFHQLFVQNDDAILLFRLDDLELIDVNPAALSLFGYDRAGILTLKPYNLIEREDFEALVDAIPQGNPVEVFQLDLAHGIHRDDTRFMIAIRCKILQLREEYVIHCSIRDITEKLQLEEEVRTAQAKLIHANKMTSIGMLASSVAHEINNPNNCISVNAAMLSDVWKDAEPLLETIHAEQGEFMLRGIPFTKMKEFAPRLLDGIREGSRRITSIVQNMRDYVREDRNSFYGAVDVNRLIQNASSILWHHIHLHTDNFTTSLDERLPPALGNGQQIEQVIINLLTNALQSLPDKSSGVYVTTGSENGEEIIIQVRDEGRGMSEATLAHIAEPFFTTRTDDGGTGLGLYISSSIIKEHGGRLEFRSVPGLGTTAIVRLPVVK